MNKQDRTYTRTAADLERKYNFESIGQGGGGNTEQMSKFVQELSEQGTKLSKHEKNQSIHVTDDERAKWNNKLEKTIEYYGDINYLLESGFYRVGTNENLPDTCQYGQVIVSRGLDTVSQIAFSYHSGRVFTRSCNIIDNVPNWGDWVEFYSTQNPQPSNEWKLLAEKTGETATIILPTSFKELHIVIGLESYMYTFNLLYDYLTDTDVLFRNGFYLSSSTYSDVYISVNKTMISGWTVRKEGVVKEVSVKVYYK